MTQKHQKAGRAPPGRLASRSCSVIMSRLAPLHPDPDLAPALAEYAASVSGDPIARGRLSSYISALGTVGPEGIKASGWSREMTGRIRVHDPYIQQIANTIRPYFHPAPGCLYLDADFKSAHLLIAAARCREPALLPKDGVDLYTRLTAKYLPHAKKEALLAGRKAFKRAILALLNGGSYKTAARYLAPVLGDQRAVKAGERIYTWFWALPGMVDIRQQVMEKFPLVRGSRIIIRTLSGRHVGIPVEGAGGWKTILNALWTTNEAEILDRVLRRLPALFKPYGARLVAPMFDGLLVEVPAQHAKPLAKELEALMVWAAEQTGLPGALVEVEIQKAWGVLLPLGPRRRRVTRLP